MIGIFGGTFDPVHYGHIKPVLAVQQSLKLKQIRFILNRVPPHRVAPWLTVEQRLSLLTEALKDYPDVIIDQRELKRAGASYMVDTLSSLQADFPAEQLVLIVGMDVFYGIAGWHQWKSLFDFCHMVVTTRPGFRQSEIARHIDEKDYAFLASNMTEDSTALMQQKAGKILLQSVPQVDVSATQIREKILAAERNFTGNSSDDDASDSGVSNNSFSEMMPPSVYKKLRGFINDN